MSTLPPDDVDHDEPTEPEVIKQPRLWKDDGWTAKVIKNENDEGWAVAMTRDGESEPALVGPWTMGRDKKNPKPLDTNAFYTLVKTASEVLRRHEQQLHAQMHKSLVLRLGEVRLTITLDIVPDEFEPHAWLAAVEADGSEIARVKVPPTFKLDNTSATTWVENEFRRPG
jgi:hypothetical protein